MIDLDQLAESAEQTFEVVVKRGKDGTKAGFIVVGPQSKQFRHAKRTLDVLGVRVARQNKGSLPDFDSDAGDEFVADQTAASRRVIAESCTVGWFNVFRGGKEVEFSVENLKQILGLMPWAVDLIAAEVQNEANFTKG